MASETEGLKLEQLSLTPPEKLVSLEWCTVIVGNGSWVNPNRVISNVVIATCQQRTFLHF